MELQYPFATGIFLGWMLGSLCTFLFMNRTVIGMIWKGVSMFMKHPQEASAAQSLLSGMANQQDLNKLMGNLMSQLASVAPPSGGENATKRRKRPVFQETNDASHEKTNQEVDAQLKDLIQQLSS